MTNKKLVTKLPRSVRRLFPQVTEAYDSNKAIEVSVNRKDCKDAQRLNPAECALAKAAKRELHADGAIIGLSSSYIIKGNKAIRFATPDSVKREIISFDRHSDFAPGDYYLTPKSKSGKLGSYSGTKAKGTKHEPKRKIHYSVRVRILEKGSSR